MHSTYILHDSLFFWCRTAYAYNDFRVYEYFRVFYQLNTFCASDKLENTPVALPTKRTPYRAHNLQVPCISILRSFIWTAAPRLLTTRPLTMEVMPVKLCT